MHRAPRPALEAEGAHLSWGPHSDRRRRRAAVPPAEPTGVPGICFVPGWEYASRWSQPDNGYNSPSQDACAADCAADPTCDGATWIEFVDQGTKRNCWFKEWGALVALPCLPPASADKTFNALIKSDDCAGIQYLEGEVGAPFACPDEPAEQPDIPGVAPADGAAAAAAPPLDATVLPADGAAAAAAPPLDATVLPADVAADTMPAAAAAALGGPIPDLVPVEAELAALVTPVAIAPNMEYSPIDAPADADPVMDLGGGLEAATATECAQMCLDLPGCNLVTWFGADPEWPLAANCWPKTVGTPCQVPVAAVQLANAFLLYPTAPCASALHCLMRPAFSPHGD